MKLHEYNRVTRGYEQEKTKGYAWYDTDMDMLCMISKTGYGTYKWQLYDELTGLWLGISAATRKDLLESWHFFKQSKNLTREQVHGLRKSFISRRDNLKI